jgi:hypothetical protein
MTRSPTVADGLWLHVEEAVMRTDDDLRRLRQRLLALVAAVVGTMGAEQQLSPRS